MPMSRTAAPTHPHELSPLSRLVLLVAALLILFAAGGCAGMDPWLQAAGIERPGVSVDGARVTAVDFDGLDLEVTFLIDNPNRVGINLAALDYELDVAGRTLLRGDRAERLEVPAEGVGRVMLPITVRFEDLYRLYRDLRQPVPGASAGYDLTAGLHFDLPVLGRVRVPARTGGDLPLSRRSAR